MSDDGLSPYPSLLDKKIKFGRSTAVDFAVSTNGPPMLKSRTRDVSLRPLERQETQTSTRVSTEKNLRGYEGFCCKVNSPSVKHSLANRSKVKSKQRYIQSGEFFYFVCGASTGLRTQPRISRSETSLSCYNVRVPGKAGHPSHARTIGHFQNGRWNLCVEGSSGQL
jgi:hypothetical protein